MREMLTKSVMYGDLLDMMYMAKDGTVSKRRIRVLQMGESSFRAYCYMRRSRRTFTVDNVLALVPVYEKEKVVM